MAVRAQTIMTKNPDVVSPGATIEEARRLFTRYGLSAMPVAKGKSLLGILRRKATDLACQHGLGEKPVMIIMEDCAAAPPDASLKKCHELLEESRQRVLPITHDGKIVGVVTRTAVLGAAILDPDFVPTPSYEKGPDLSERLREALPRKTLQRVRKIGRLAGDRGFCSYLVGGCVRDLVLGRPNLDVDIVIEGNAIEIAVKAGKAFSCRVKRHSPFLSATLFFPDGEKIDLASARREYYNRPAELPVIGLSSRTQDLIRRDFTINTLALKIGPKDFGELIDPFGGQRDLMAGLVRSLHPLSFIEDPTRIMRAARFEARFGFHMDEATDRHARFAIREGYPHRLSGQRLATELRLILEEEDPIRALRRLKDLKVLGAYHPGLLSGKGSVALLERLKGVLSESADWPQGEKPEPWKAAFLALLDGLDEKEAGGFLGRLEKSGKAAEKLLSQKWSVAAAHALLSGPTVPRGSTVFRALSPLSAEGIAVFLAKTHTKKAREAVRDFLFRLRKLRPQLTGEDLQNLGFPPGPELGSALRHVRDNLLDGTIRTRAEQLALAKTLLPKEKGRT